MSEKFDATGIERRANTKDGIYQLLRKARERLLTLKQKKEKDSNANNDEFFSEYFNELMLRLEAEEKAQEEYENLPDNKKNGQDQYKRAKKVFDNIFEADFPESFFKQVRKNQKSTEKMFTIGADLMAPGGISMFAQYLRGKTFDGRELRGDSAYAVQAIVGLVVKLSTWYFPLRALVENFDFTLSGIEESVKAGGESTALSNLIANILKIIYLGYQVKTNKADLLDFAEKNPKYKKQVDWIIDNMDLLATIYDMYRSAGPIDGTRMIATALWLASRNQNTEQ